MLPMSIVSTTLEEYSENFMTDLLTNAKEYCKCNHKEIILEPILGAGTDGTVWQSQQGTAIKALGRTKNFLDELKCYRRLREKKVTEILGFAVPELEGHSNSLQVIEISIVQPPYLIDFGKVYIDRPPPYLGDPIAMSNWHTEGRDNFGGDWNKVQSVLGYLKNNFGIWYVDPKPANIHF